MEASLKTKTFALENIDCTSSRCNFSPGDFIIKFDFIFIWLGFPIVGDPLYNTLEWGENKGKGGRYGYSRDEVVRNFDRSRRLDLYEIDKVGLVFVITFFKIFF